VINSEKIKNVFFRDDLESLITNSINNARESVIVVNFWFDYKPIADILIKARERGVNVKVLTDYRSSTKQMKDNKQIYEESIVFYLKSKGIETYIYNRLVGNAIMHHKFLLIDDATVLFGSHNLNLGSTEYADSIMLIESKEIYTKFYDEFIRLKNISEYNILETNSLINVFFSSDRIDNFIISQIRRATEKIIVVHGYFDYKPIADALIERNQNNVDVVILTDISARYSQMIDATSIYGTSLLKYLYIRGIENIYIYNESSKKRMHNKYILIDNNYFIYGSYNFHRDSAVFDEESVIAYENEEIYKKLFDEYLYLKSKADKYTKYSMGGGGGG
jgi:phosphatidylserine/phosphatidylglycerophosphate/cardiolipin synthase-like enzyme